MNSSNCNYIQRKITPKSLDVHPIENALIIDCEAEVSFVNDSSENDDYLIEKTKKFEKIIRLQSFNQETDINLLSKDVINRSENLISPSQEQEVQKLLTYLKNRKTLSTKTINGSDLNNFRPKTANPRIQHSNSTNFITKNQNVINNRLSYSASSQTISSFNEIIDYQLFYSQIENDFKENEVINKFYSNNKININKLNEYIELLYEDNDDKLLGAVNIYKLSLENENLVSLTVDDSLFCALSRILREEGKKSTDLICLILAFFCNISFYKDFHSTLLKYKIGSTTIDLIEQLFEKENNFRTQFKIDDQNDTSQENLMNKKKFELSQRQNNRLLYHCFFLLLNLSSDLKIENKIFNRSIINHLITTLNRSNLSLNLQVVIITFLHRLSVKFECKNEMFKLSLLNIIQNILNNIVNQISYYTSLTTIILKLIFNLTFDTNFRNQMIKQGFIHKLIQILIKSRFKNEKIIILIFYQFTLTKKYKNFFIVTLSTGKNLLNLFVERTLKMSEKLDIFFEFNLENDNCFLEYSCLMINLSMDKDCAQIICENSALEKIINKAINENLNDENCSYVNINLMKVLRNLSIHEQPYKMLFLEYYEMIIKLLVNFDTETVEQNDFKLNSFGQIFISQALSILANLQKVDWLKVIKKENFFDWVIKRIKVGNNFSKEIVLSSLSFLESCFTQKDCAAFLIEINLIQILIELLNAKQEDDKIVMHILFVINSMANHETICGYLVKNEKIINYLFDLINDKNQQVSSTSCYTLELISAYDNDLKQKLKRQRFENYNRSWLESRIIKKNLNYLDEDENFNCENTYFSEQLFNLIDKDFLKKQDLLSSFSSSEKSLHKLKNKTSKTSIPLSNDMKKVDRSSRPQTAYKNRTKSGKIN